MTYISRCRYTRRKQERHITHGQASKQAGTREQAVSIPPPPAPPSPTLRLPSPPIPKKKQTVLTSRAFITMKALSSSSMVTATMANTCAVLFKLLKACHRHLLHRKGENLYSKRCATHDQARRAVAGRRACVSQAVHWAVSVMRQTDLRGRQNEQLRQRELTRPLHKVGRIHFNSMHYVNTFERLMYSAPLSHDSVTTDTSKHPNTCRLCTRSRFTKTRSGLRTQYYGVSMQGRPP